MVGKLPLWGVVGWVEWGGGVEWVGGWVSG